MNDTTKPSEYLGYWGEKYKNDLLPTFCLSG